MTCHGKEVRKSFGVAPIIYLKHFTERGQGRVLGLFQCILYYSEKLNQKGEFIMPEKKKRTKIKDITGDLSRDKMEKVKGGMAGNCGGNCMGSVKAATGAKVDVARRQKW